MEVIKRDLQEFADRSGADTQELLRVWKNTSHRGVWIGGGAVRRTLIKKPLDSDFDFFFKDVDTFKSWEASLPKTIIKVRETKHHTEYKGTLEGSDIPVILQAIQFKYYTDAADVLDSFDYTITQFVTDGHALWTTPEALWDLGRMRLALHKVTYPVATMRRMLKYSNQGFTACGGCMTQLYTMTMDNPDALAQMDITYVD